MGLGEAGAGEVAALLVLEAAEEEEGSELSCVPHSGQHSFLPSNVWECMASAQA